MSVVTRSVITTKVNVLSVINRNGEFVFEKIGERTINSTKKLSEKAIEKIIKREFPASANLYPKVVNETEQIYGLDLDKFVELASIVTRPKSQSKHKGE